MIRLTVLVVSSRGRATRHACDRGSLLGPGGGTSHSAGSRGVDVGAGLVMRSRVGPLTAARRDNLVLISEIKILGVVFQVPGFVLDRVHNVLDCGELIVSDVLGRDETPLNLGQDGALPGVGVVALEASDQRVQISEKLL